MRIGELVQAGFLNVRVNTLFYATRVKMHACENACMSCERPYERDGGRHGNDWGFASKLGQYGRAGGPVYIYVHVVLHLSYSRCSALAYNAGPPRLQALAFIRVGADSIRFGAALAY